MRKFILAVKITVAVVVILGITMFSMLSYASSKTENEYKSIFDNMGRGNYSEAARIAESIPHYKESNELLVYLYPHKLYSEQYNSLTEKIQGYSRAISYIKGNNELLKGKNEDKYFNGLLELEKVLAFKIEVMNIQLENDASRIAFDEGVNLIKQGAYPEALEKLNAVDDRLQYVVDKHHLINYINLINAVNIKDDKAIRASLQFLNPNYTGALGEEIKALALSRVSLGKWNELFTSKNKDAVIPAFINVGIKKDELIQLRGNAVSSSVVANEYGIFEKMVYEDRTVYLENDLVTVVR